MEKEEKRPVEDPARADWGLERLDTIVPSLQDLGRQIMPTLPSLSQEGEHYKVGALGLNLHLLGGEVEDLFPHPLEWPCCLGNQRSVVTAGSCWMPRHNFFIDCLIKGQGRAEGFDSTR